MAENTADKTQEPTPKRLRDARKKGQLARSRELATLAIVAGAVLVISVVGPRLGRGAMAFLDRGLRLEREQMTSLAAVQENLGSSLISGFAWAMPFLLAGLLAAFVGPLLFGGWNYSPKALVPDFKRLNPVTGLGRIFSANALMELLKALAKFVLLGGLAVAVLWAYNDRVLGLGAQAVRSGVVEGLGLCFATVASLCLGLAVIAAIDVPFQFHAHRKKMKMSIREVKDEMKETEGRPEVKQHIRRMQQEAARRRMAQDMPTAHVVINNPEHFSVALRYDPDSGGAPEVIAKGADHLAEVIRELALENAIPQLRMPALARSLYRFVKVGEEIPSGLYLAVAQVLSYIFALNRHPQQAGSAPDPEIPAQYRWSPAQHQAETSGATTDA